MFGVAWTEAIEAGTEVLEDEARRRAVDGVDEPVFQGGELVGHVRRYSDRLLEFLLRGRRPTVYREGASVDVHLPGSHVHFEPDPERTARVLEKLRDVGLLTHVPQRGELPPGDDSQRERASVRRARDPAALPRRGRLMPALRCAASAGDREGS